MAPVNAIVAWAECRPTARAARSTERVMDRLFPGSMRKTVALAVSQDGSVVTVYSRESPADGAVTVMVPLVLLAPRSSLGLITGVISGGGGSGGTSNSTMSTELPDIAPL